MHIPRCNDGSWPQIEATATTVRSLFGEPYTALSNVTIRVARTSAVNVRYRFADGLLDSMTMTMVVPVPLPAVV